MKQDWSKLLSQERFKFDYSKNKLTIEANHKANNFRTIFNQDYDRIIFSNSFRRLSRKTQVHPLSENDHIHNRLTHSLEVASVGRSLGLSAGYLLSEKIDKNISPYDVSYIVQTACLAHDIGNPPFGHSGEDSIKNWFDKKENEKYIQSLKESEKNDFKYFDGNAQSFRIVCKIENHLNKGGLCLSFAALGALIKYPRSSGNSQNPNKFSFFQSEKEIFETVFDRLGLNQQGEIKRHPLSYLMEVADDICYSLLDIKDAIELDLIKLKDVLAIFKLFELEQYDRIVSSSISDIKKASTFSGLCIDKLAKHSMTIFENNLEKLSQNNEKHFIELFTDTKLKDGIKQAKNFGYDKIFKTPNKTILEINADKHISFLLDTYIKAIYHEDNGNITKKESEALEQMKEDRPNKNDSLYHKYQSIVDYISGMTDNYVLLCVDKLKKS